MKEIVKIKPSMDMIDLDKVREDIWGKVWDHIIANHSYMIKLGWFTGRLNTPYEIAQIRKTLRMKPNV